MAYPINWRYFSLLECPLYGRQAGSTYTKKLRDALVATGALGGYVQDFAPQPGNAEAPLLALVRSVAQSESPQRPWIHNNAFSGLALKVRSFLDGPLQVPTGEVILTPGSIVLSWPFFEAGSQEQKDLEAAATAQGISVATLAAADVPASYLFAGNALETGDYAVWCHNGSLGPPTDSDATSVLGPLQRRALPNGAAYGFGTGGVRTTGANPENSRVVVEGGAVTLVVGRDTSAVHGIDAPTGEEPGAFDTDGLWTDDGGEGPEATRYPEYPCGAITGQHPTC